MRSKQRKCDKINFHLPEYLHKDFKENYICIKYLRDVLSVSEGIEQINILKEIESYIVQEELIEDELHLIVDALCIMFCQAPNKSSHKKALNKTIQEISEKYPSTVETYLQKSVEVVMNSALNTSIEEIEESALHIIYLTNNLKLGKKVIDQNSGNVWKYASLILEIIIQQLKQEIYIHKKKDNYDVCQNILKLVTQCIQSCDCLKESLKCNNDEKFKDSCKNIRICLEYLLTSKETILNCRLSAAFAFCHYYYFSFGEKKFKDDMLSENSNQFPLSSQLCILSSIMAVLPPGHLVERINDHMIAEKILLEILKMSKNSDSSQELMLCARNMLQWTNVIQDVFSKDCEVDKNQISSISHMFSMDNKVMKMLFEYVLHNKDHFIDSIRHLSKDIFRNILNIHILSSGVEPSKSPLLKEITIYLLKDLSSHIRGKYGMLSCIVEKIGTQTILEWHSLLPTELYKALEEYSLVSHVSELCQVLFSQHSGDDKNFQITWLVPLLKMLCEGSKEQTSAISEHILPKLLDVKPSNLTFLLPELCKMWDNNIGNSFSALITCMKVYQKQKGSLTYLEFMSTNSLIKAFLHTDDHVRLSAFALLCESYKTTEPIDSNSFELIKCGLRYNINCQSASFRQQLISFIKKLLKRMHESGYALMKKQICGNEDKNILPKVILPNIYQEFLQWLKKYLFSCIYPGANFPRRVTSLNLLYILHEIFQHTFPVVDSEVAVQTLLYAFQDTYDNNKLLALKILSSKFSMKLKKEDDTLFWSALKLASSTKPPDTATATYLFTYMIQCPCYQLVIQNHLHLLAKEFNFNLTLSKFCNYNIHMSIIAILMHELNKQLNIAIKSLLEAATFAPLYGVLSCIRSIFNDVKYFNKESIAYWQDLLKDLIQLSLTVGNIVEPIVCNSSPEGYLPVDINDDSITQLQAAARKALACRFQSVVVQENPSVESDTVVLDVVKAHAVTAQMLLLCSWRTHREVSLLFGDIFEKVPMNCESLCSFGVLNGSQVEMIGSYFIRQMSLVKHKGAFEQAHIGFTKICKRLWRCDDRSLCELPKIWLESIIMSIKGLNHNAYLNPTRRSAGLPFLIQTILGCEPFFSNSSFFRKIISTFLELCQPSEMYSSDVQVHALNILKTLVKDACFGEAIMPFVSEGFKIAIKGFKSQFWAVRNSSTSLFSALMTRIFGVNRSHDAAGKKNRLTGKCFYSYYKDLYFFLIDELKQCVSSLDSQNENKETKLSIQPSLYPILLFLGRLYPAPGEEDTILSIFNPYLTVCASTSVWKIRTLAAKALVSFTPCEKIIPNLKLLFESFTLIRPFYQNEIHGELLQILYLMEEIDFISDTEKNSLKHEFESAFFKSLLLYLRENKCASTKAVFLQIYLYAMVLDIESDDLFYTGSLFQIVMKEFDDVMYSKSTADLLPDKDNYLSISAAILFLKSFKLNKMDLLELFNGRWPGWHSHLELVTYLIFNPNKAVSSTVTEIFLWLLQDDYESFKYCSDSSHEIIVQRVLKIVNLMDRKKFNVRSMNEEPYLCSHLVESFQHVKDPSLLKQYCKLMSFTPSSLIMDWNFLKASHSCDLLNKLEFILSEVENHSRDDVICELILCATHIFVKLGHEYENKNNYLFVQSDFKVIEKWLEKVEEFSYPDNNILLRQTVVSILSILTEKSLFLQSELLGSNNSYLWQSLLLVLIDDEPEIKHKASEIVMKLNLMKSQGNIFVPVPSKAVDLMVELYIESNHGDSKNCISMLVNWMLSSNTFPLDSVNDEQPFDKGEMNVFSEDLNLTDIVSKHLSSYLGTWEPCEENLILPQKVLCWKDKQDGNLKFEEVITLCFSETNSIIDSFVSRTTVSPILDAYFNQELIQIKQRLAVALGLIPFSDILPNFKILANELLKKLQGLDFRTFFIEDIISNIQGFLTQLQS